MIELLLCSLLTVLPDYLFRRYVQDKRFGREITLYSVWYELRWGIVACLMLTVALITTIFYFHPSTTSAVTLFRTVPILPERSGRVEEVFVGGRDFVRAGDPIFAMDDAQPRAALETARRRIAEVEAEIAVAEADLEAADARVREAESSLRQASDRLETRTELRDRNPDNVPARQIEQLQNAADERRGALDEAQAARRAISRRLDAVLPARRARAEAELAEAQVALDKAVVRAGVDGRVEQFALRPGDMVNPMLRPAGVLVPDDQGRRGIVAGFGQIEAQVIGTGMVGEAVCISQPFEIIPLVVTEVQSEIASGQFRVTDRLLDAANLREPGTLTTLLEPLYDGGLANVTPGSSCIVNVYSSNHERLQTETLTTGRRLFLHLVDTVGLVHAVILRAQALLMPVQTLVLGEH